MPCYHPLDAYRTADGSIVFVDNLRRNDVVDRISLPCGRCVGCRLERSRQWAVRCMHEASLYDANSFVTLTYDNDHLPEYNSLEYRHFQLFMKRLRKAFAPTVIRFYMCGEYGDDLSRPHYHACLFNCYFADRRRLSAGGSGATLYSSDLLSSLWPYGFSSIGDVTFESAAYVARYVMKKVTGDAAESYYTTVDPLTGEVSKRVPEFNKMSLRPGIGATWFERFHSDVYPRDKVVVRGVESKPPRYYDKKFYKSHPDLVDDFKYRRYTTAQSLACDATDERLRVREEVTLARVNAFSRNLEAFHGQKS